MRRIIRRREIVSDDWRYPGAASDAVTGPAGGHVVLALADFLAAAQAGSLPTGGAGVQLEPADEVEQLAPWLDRVALVVAHFPKNGEGRGFTQGQLLRRRYHYQGEMRAAGAIKRDHLFHLARCGFDSFDLDPAEDLDAARAAFDSFTVGYQPASDLSVNLRARRIP